METRQFELSDGKSDKFWRISIEGATFTVVFGRRGTSGQTQTKEFSSTEAARKAHDAIIAEKAKKGYIEVGANGHSEDAQMPASKRVPKQPVKVSDQPPPTVEPIVLDPCDWAYATWRPRAVKPRPAAPAFSIEDGLKRLDRGIGSQRWQI